MGNKSRFIKQIRSKKTKEIQHTQKKRKEFIPFTPTLDILPFRDKIEFYTTIHSKNRKICNINKSIDEKLRNINLYNLKFIGKKWERIYKLEIIANIIAYCLNYPINTIYIETNKIEEEFLKFLKKSYKFCIKAISFESKEDCQLIKVDLNITKNCHYVPRSYLKNFSSNQKKTKIWQFDKKTNEIIERKIESIAKEKYFYSTFIENWLERTIENPGRKVINKIQQRDSIDELTQQEKLNLVKWIIIQELRTKETRESLRYQYNDMIKKIGEKFLNLKSDSYEIEFNEKFIEANQYELMMKFLNIAPKLCEYFWHLQVNNTNLPFITADQCVVLTNSFQNSQKKALNLKYLSGGTGWLSEGVEIYCPLSPKLCLLIVNNNIKRVMKKEDNKIKKDLLSPIEQKIYKSYIENSLKSKANVKYENVEYIHSVLAANSYKYLYSSSKDSFTVVSDFLEEFPSYREIDRQRCIID